MRALIKQACTCVCEPGSIVEMTPDQFSALGVAAVALEGEGVSKVDTPSKGAKNKPKNKPKEG